MNCTNCNIEIVDKFCSKCGQAAEVKRIDKHYLLHEVVHVLHFEKGILYTTRELLLRPGITVKKFLLEDRSRIVKPIIFVIVTSLIYTIINSIFHIEEQYINANAPNLKALSAIFKWQQNHYGYTNLFMSVFIAFYAKWFFKKYNYNYFEILILLCFVMGITMLLYAFFALIQGFIHYKILSFAGLIGILYSTWAIGSFFDKSIASSYAKAFCAFFIGMISYFVLVVGIGLVIDLLFLKK